MDSEASKLINEFLSNKFCWWQFVLLNKRRVDAAKRANQTFKIYFISGFSTSDTDFLLQLWDQLLPEAHTECVKQIKYKKMMYEVLESIHGFQYNPW